MTDSVVGVSIEPRDVDKEPAMYQLLSMLLDELSHESIARLMIYQQQKIIQAERLRDKVLDEAVV